MQRRAVGLRLAWTLVVVGALLVGVLGPTVSAAVPRPPSSLMRAPTGVPAAPAANAMPEVSGGNVPAGRMAANLTFTPPGDLQYWPSDGVYDPENGEIYSAEEVLEPSGPFNYLLSATPGSLSLSSSNLTLAGEGYALAYDSNNGAVYIGEQNLSNSFSQVQEYDPSTGTLSAPVVTSFSGFTPSMAFDGSNDLLYFTSVKGPTNHASASAALQVLDTLSGTLFTNGPTMSSSFYPELLALDSSNSTLFVAGFNKSSPTSPLEVVAVNLSTYAEVNLTFSALTGNERQPGSIAFDPTDGCVYFASDLSSSTGPTAENVSVIDAATMSLVTSLSLPPVPPSLEGDYIDAAGSITFDPANSYLYLTQNQGPLFESEQDPSNTTVVVLNGTSGTTGNPVAYLTSSLFPSGGVYVPPTGPSEGGELWLSGYSAATSYPAVLRGGYSIVALPPHVASFVATPSTVDANGSATSFTVLTEFGAGTVSFGYQGLPSGCEAEGRSSFSCTPTDPGRFSVGVTVTDQFSDVATASTTVVVNPELGATGSVSTLTPDVGEPLAFSVTPAGGEEPYQVAWSFGDGAGAVTGTAIHAYDAAGTYEAAYTVTDALGVEVTGSYRVAVSAVPSEASIVASRTSVDVGTTVDLSATVQNGSLPLTETWTFGDAGSATGSEVTHAYAAAGTYLVTLTVTDADGSTTSSTVWIAVAADPTGVLQISPTNLAVGASATFDETVSGGTGPFTYLWTFGDGTTSTAASPTHEFTTARTYDVSVRVTDASGMSVENSTTVVVTAASPSSSAVSPSGLTPTQSAWLGTGSALAGVAVGATVAVLWSRRKTPPPPSG
jgi:PKD repeat protein